MSALAEIGNALVTALKLIFSGDPEVYQIAARSLEVSGSSTLIGSLIFTSLGALIYFNNFRGKRILINIIQTSYSVPTVFIGLLVYIVISASGPLGGLGLVFTPPAMVIAQVILISPILTGLTISAMRNVGNEIKYTAISLGATRSQAIWTMMKEARYAILSAVLIAFGRAISEVGAAMIVGGNIRGGTRILTTAMALETSMGNIELSMALGIIILALALIVSILVNRLQQR